MSIIVTGGLGFIGSHFVRQLLHECRQTTLYNIDYQGYGSNVFNISDIRKNRNHIFLKENINNISRLHFPEKPEIIVNIAAESHVDRSIQDPRPFIMSNIIGTYELLEYARKNDVSKYIQVSTDEVYGEAPEGCSFKESDCLHPNNPYSASKASADLLVTSYHRTYGIKAAITRCTNNYGSNQFSEKLVPKTVIRIIKGLPIEVYGSGTQIRDWIYVMDHVKALIMIMMNGRNGEIYNISSSNLISNLDMIKRIASIMKKKIGKNASITHTKDRPGHDTRYSLDSSKIMEELGWKPIANFDSELEKTVVWYIKNRLWWDHSRNYSNHGTNG
jgi:dTDP-glucose 4,6-dehydratase